MFHIRVSSLHSSLTSIHLIFIDEGKSREEGDRLIADEIDKRGADVILLIGWMRILSASFVQRYHGSFFVPMSICWDPEPFSGRKNL